MYQWHLLVSLAVITVIEAHREKRQLSIDDLISKALSLVRPIFDTSQPLQYDEMFKKQVGSCFFTFFKFLVRFSKAKRTNSVE
uniref:Secreted protein n=1 Tax=Angiostrongylus cantonensis TaxID=6313 RepID=A0A0K0D5E5_ANGCA